MNKRLYAEAAEVLYHHNVWIPIQIETDILNLFAIHTTVIGPGDQTTKSFSGDPTQNRRADDSPQLKSHRYLGNAPLSMDIRSKWLNKTSPPVHLVISEFALQRFLQCAVTLPFYIMEVRWQGGHDQFKQSQRLLEHLYQARSCVNVEVHGLSSAAECTELISSMTYHEGHWDEKLARLRRYQEKVQSQSSGIGWGRNRCDCQYGIEYVDNCLQRLITHDMDLDTMDPSADLDLLHAISNVRMELGLVSATSSLHINDLTAARATIKRTFFILRSARLLTDKQHAEIYYTMASIFLALKAENASAYCLLSALTFQPGHTAADKAVDEMEARLRGGIDSAAEVSLTQPPSKTDAIRRLVLHNIETIMKRFRHQNPDVAASHPYIEWANVVNREFCVTMDRCHTGIKETKIRVSSPNISTNNDADHE